MIKCVSIRQILYCIMGVFPLFNCTRTDKKESSGRDGVVKSILFQDSLFSELPEVQFRIARVKEILNNPVPVMRLENTDDQQKLAETLALKDTAFLRDVYEKETRSPLRSEIFNVYKARVQEVPVEYQHLPVYKVEMYNYARNLTTTALVDVQRQQVIKVVQLKDAQPDIPADLKELALKIAVHSPSVIEALGYKPGEEDALMANTKTALNNTRCEQSKHLCVAPTFIKGNKALWVIVDLTDFRVVGIRWTEVGTTGEVKRLSEQDLRFDKIMECFCLAITPVKKGDWEFNYVITTSDGLRISEVKYKGVEVIHNAKVVDWHVNYSNTDGFGYSDAVGCPEFSQAAVIAVTEPRISEILENGKKVGYTLEQNFNSVQWPLPCNYNYLQRFEFYDDGRFRMVAASLGRGCGNNGTYRPVSRIALAGKTNSFYEWKSGNWDLWKKEQWQLQDSRTQYTREGYQYKIENAGGKNGYFIEPGRGQFGDGGRGDNAYLYVTKRHLDRDEGENDLVTIGPCCNTDYRQGPEKFIEPAPEAIENEELVIWYVPQMKNDDRKGAEYCWAESYLDKGVYKTRVYPCMSGPMLVPIK